MSSFTTPITACHQYNTVAVQDVLTYKIGYRLSSCTYKTFTLRPHVLYLYRMSSLTIVLSFTLPVTGCHYSQLLSEEVVLTYNACYREPLYVYNSCSRVSTLATPVYNGVYQGVFCVICFRVSQVSSCIITVLVYSTVPFKRFCTLHCGPTAFYTCTQSPNL